MEPGGLTISTPAPMKVVYTTKPHITSSPREAMANNMWFVLGSINNNTAQSGVELINTSRILFTSFANKALLSQLQVCTGIELE